MAGIQFISGAPALDQFNARVGAADQARRQEEQDFRQRFLLERQQGTDRALREAALADVDARGATMAPALPVAQPRGPVMPPAVAPPAGAQGSVPAVQPPNQALDALAVPAETMRNEQSRITAADVVAPGAGMQTEATAQTAPAVLPVARPRPGVGTSDAMVRRLAQTPGTGDTLMRMYQADRTERRATATAERTTELQAINAFRSAAEKGDITTMRLVNERYRLGIPEQAMRNREVVASIATGINLAKSYDDERAVAFGMGYTEAIGSGASLDQAVLAGNRAAQKAQVAPKKSGTPHYYTAADNTVQAVGPDLVARPVQGPRARQPQPPFNITPAGVEVRNQGLRDKAITNARQAAGGDRRFARLAPDVQQQLIDDHYNFLNRGTPLPDRSGQPAPADVLPGANNDPLGLRAR